MRVETVKVENGIFERNRTKNTTETRTIETSLFAHHSLRCFIYLCTRACTDKTSLKHHAEVDRNGTTPTATTTGNDSSAGTEETAAAAISMPPANAVSADNLPVRQHDFTAAHLSKPPITKLRIPSSTATDGIQTNVNAKRPTSRKQTQKAGYWAGHNND